MPGRRSQESSASMSGTTGTRSVLPFESTCKTTSGTAR